MNAAKLSKRFGVEIDPDGLLSLFEVLPDAYFFAKDSQSRIVYLNQASRELLAVKTEADYFGKTDMEFFPPTMAAAYVAEDRMVMSEGPLLNRIWLVHNLSYLLPQWFVSSKVPLVSTKGEVVGIAGVMHQMNSTQLQTRYFQELKPVIEFVESKFAENVSMDHLAAMIPCSRTQLNRRFKTLLHMTPTEFLMAHRIQAARKLLATTDEEVADIAGTVGFCDQSHLTRRFRLVTGETPAAFRRNFQKKSGH